MRNFYIISLLMLISLNSCNDDSEEPEDLNTTLGINDEVLYSESFRPQFHFSPPEKWMNDPNGLVYNDGIYHLFYQYYPEDIVWGPMHWGHAISKDLINWENKPIALFPDENGYIFSGSAVVDTNNTSGLGTKENPPLVAIFTYHDMEGEKAGNSDYQTQGIAYSLDNGDTWTVYDRNPVIRNNGIKDFRDPKVFWHEESKQWIMALVAGDHAKFYRSRNLKYWTVTGEFGKDKGAHGGVWECPDLFKLKVEGGDEEEKWVLLISINPGAPNGGSGTQYFIGDFDGRTFTAEHEDERWVDMGTDNYAGVTYNNIPSGERIFIGWMSNWNYADKTPTKSWRSAMTLPRKLSLHKDVDSSYVLKNFPVKQFDAQRIDYKRIHKVIEEGPFALEHHELSTSEIGFKLNLKDDYSVTLKNNKGESFIFKLDPKKNEFSVDRRKSGIVDFEERFAGIHKQTFKPVDAMVDVRMIIDRSSIEIFIDEGRYVFTEQVFPTEPYSQFEIASESATFFKGLEIFLVKPIWKKDD